MTDLYIKILDILPKIAANASLTEDLGRVPDENVELLRSMGFFKALQPKAFGGTEVDFPEYAECIIKIAEACPSTAWACALLANHSHGVAIYSERLQDEIWGDNPNALLSSSVAPLGKWEPASGGIRLSGNFGWSSGCEHADWAILGYMGTNNMRQPGPCFAIVPRSDYKILDDWDSMALTGTGSKTIQLDQVFVPNYRCESLFALNNGLTQGFGSHDGHIFHAPFSPVFSLGFAAVAIGIARRFADIFKEKTINRIRAYTGAREVESVPAHIRLAESINQTTSAYRLLQRDWAEMSACAKNRRFPTPDETLNWRCHQAYAVKMAIEAVDRMFAAGGGGAWYRNNEMQRLFRDVHITGSHAQTDYDIAAQTFGRYILGLPMDRKFY